MTLQTVAMNAASSSGLVESIDATTQSKEAKAGAITSCRTTDPGHGGGLVVEVDPCISSPLASKKAFFESVFKKKESSTPKKLVTKVWPPRGNVLESSSSSIPSEVIRQVSSP